MFLQSSGRVKNISKRSSTAVGAQNVINVTCYRPTLIIDHSYARDMCFDELNKVQNAEKKFKMSKSLSKDISKSMRLEYFCNALKSEINEADYETDSTAVVQDAGREKTPIQVENKRKLVVVDVKIMQEKQSDTKNDILECNDVHFKFQSEFEIKDYLLNSIERENIDSNSDYSDRNVDWCIAVNNDTDCNIITKLKKSINGDQNLNNSKQLQNLNYENDLSDVEIEEIFVENRPNNAVELNKNSKMFIEHTKVVQTFDCHVCSSSFKDEIERNQHVRVLHGSTKNRAKIENPLKELQNTENDVNDAICKVCFIKFPNVKVNNTDFICSSCKTKAIKNEEKQDETVTRSESAYTKQTFHCKICGNNKQYTYKGWYSHMKEVHSNKLVNCKLCSMQFKCQRYLQKHIKYVHKGERRGYQRKLKSTSEAEANTEHGRTEYECSKCPKKFNTSYSLTQHTRNCHDTAVQCELCDSKLKSNYYLSTHMRRVHYDGPVNQSICKVCFKVLKSPRQVRIHTRNLHPELMHTCIGCKRLFKSKTDLEKHYKKSTICSNKLGRDFKVKSDDSDLDVVVE